MDQNSADLPARIARLLERAVEASGKSHSQIARGSGLKRDCIRRTLSGERSATLAETLAILDAADHAGEETLLLLMLAGEDFALERAGTAPAQFLADLLRRAPAEIIQQLGGSLEDLQPRWAIGTAKLLAHTLMQHVAEINRRGDAIGEHYPR